MKGTESDLEAKECRCARRLIRLFAVERAGGLSGRPIESIWRLIGRRDRLIDELLRLDVARRALAKPVSAELGQAIRELRYEASRAQHFCRARLDALGGELAQRRGSNMATGLRDGADGRLLGRG